MKVLLVVAHPEPKSFNFAMAQVAIDTFSRNGHEIITSDLYRMQFNPVSDRRNFQTVKDGDYYKQQIEELYATEKGGFAADIEGELAKLDWCDLLILQFPLWWFGLPAIMKGWVDKVFAMGRIYSGEMRYDRGYFQGKRAMCCLTTGGGAEHYRDEGMVGDIDQILYPINHGILYFVGFSVLPATVIYQPVRLSPEERQQRLEEYRMRLSRIHEVPSIKYKTMDEVAAAEKSKVSY